MNKPKKRNIAKLEGNIENVDDLEFLIKSKGYNQACSGYEAWLKEIDKDLAKAISENIIGEK